MSLLQSLSTKIDCFDWRCDMVPPPYVGVRVHPPKSGLAWTMRCGHLDFWCWREKPKGRKSFYRIDNDKTRRSTRPFRQQFLQALMNALDHHDRLDADEVARMKDSFTRQQEAGL